MAARLQNFGRLARCLRNISMPKYDFAVSNSLRSLHNSAALLADAIRVKMPSLSPTMMEGSIVEWHKKEGDSVAAGDILCDIQTDKAIVGFEVDEDGILAKILMPASSGLLQINTLIALMVEEGEDWQGVAVPADAASTDAGSDAPAVPQASRAAETEHGNSAMQGAGPAVRTLLDQYGISPSDVRGTGPHNNIIKGDVLKYIESKSLQPVAKAPTPVTQPVIPSSVSTAPQPIPAPSPQAAPSHTPAPPPQQPRVTEGDGFVDLDLTTMRKVIAKRLTESKTSTPHAYSTIDCSMGNLLSLRKSIISEGVKVSVNDFIIKACAVALQRVPEVNALWSEDGGKVLSNIDISVAVATDAGLITPIVKDAIGLGVEEISQTIRELASRAKEGKLKPDEFQGGTFTISNLGMFGVSEFTAVINPPQACIMAVGASRLELGLDGKPQTRMKVTISADARMVDEFLATRFLEAFRETVENPMLMLSQSPKVDLQRLFAK